MLTRGIWCLAPVAGNGWIYAASVPSGVPIPDPACSWIEYATHRPSGEKTALIGRVDWMSPKGAAFLSSSEKLQSEAEPAPVTAPRSARTEASVDTVVTSNKNRFPPGNQDAGTWDVPCAALVSQARTRAR